MPEGAILQASAYVVCLENGGGIRYHSNMNMQSELRNWNI